MIRSRAITTTRLAHAQLAQGAPDAATAIAMKVPAESATHHAWVARMLQEFGAALRATAPGNSTVQTWKSRSTSSGASLNRLGAQTGRPSGAGARLSIYQPVMTGNLYPGHRLSGASGT